MVRPHIQKIGRYRIRINGISRLEPGWIVSFGSANRVIKRYSSDSLLRCCSWMIYFSKKYINIPIRIIDRQYGSCIGLMIDSILKNGTQEMIICRNQIDNDPDYIYTNNGSYRSIKSEVADQFRDLELVSYTLNV